MSNVPLMPRTMRIHHQILISYGKYSQETNFSSPNGDDDVTGIMFDMLTKSQGHKENDDQVHEDVEDDATMVKDSGMDNHD